MCAAISAAEFKSLTKKPLGYNDFCLFHVGDYEYKNAIVRLTLSTPSLGSNPEVYDVVMNVDIEDTVSRGQQTLAAGENFIAYGKPYYTCPEVTATISGGTAAAYNASVVLTDIGETGFKASIIKPDGTSCAGVISWTAVGY